MELTFAFLGGAALVNSRREGQSSEAAFVSAALGVAACIAAAVIHAAFTLNI